MSIVLQARGLSKSFKRYPRTLDRLLELLGGRQRHQRHVALEEISFSLSAGETLGILGCNGAGKSTLLKLLNGVLLPDSGELERKGQITALLELGTGFDLNQTGRKNITTNGLLIGMSRKQIAAAEQEIIDFSELGEAIEQPLRTYSSGMVVRLAFAIAIHARPACFLVDEALSVGDGHFQQKCIRKIREFRDAGGAIIFVSHDLNAVKVLCDRAIVLNKGRVALEGSAEEAVNLYNQLMGEQDQQAELLEAQQRNAGFGSGEAKITGATLAGQDSGTALVSAGEKVRLTFQLEARQSLADLTLGVLIRDRFGQDIFGTNTCLSGYAMALDAGEQRELVFELEMNIAPGKYTVTAALHAERNHLESCYHWCDNLLRFEVAGIKGQGFSGLCRLPCTVQDVAVEPEHG